MAKQMGERMRDYCHMARALESSTTYICILYSYFDEFFGPLILIEKDCWPIIDGGLRHRSSNRGFPLVLQFAFALRIWREWNRLCVFNLENKRQKQQLIDWVDTRCCPDGNGDGREIFRARARVACYCLHWIQSVLAANSTTAVSTLAAACANPCFRLLCHPAASIHGFLWCLFTESLVARPL